LILLSEEISPGNPIIPILLSFSRVIHDTNIINSQIKRSS
jgi:hypothetical protein